MTKAVIFDCFGVLVNGTFDEVYARAGGDPDKDAKFIGDLLGAANLGLITPAEMRQQSVEKTGIPSEVWEAAITSTQFPSEDMLAYAESLKDRYMIAILSNANIGTLQRKFTAEQLAIFNQVVVSAEVHLMKPDPTIYRLVAERLGVQPDECIFIDDSQGFCDAAAAVGMQTVCCKTFAQTRLEVDKLLAYT